MLNYDVSRMIIKSQNKMVAIVINLFKSLMKTYRLIHKNSLLLESMFRILLIETE